MSIKESLEKIKPFYLLFILLAITSIVFAVGRLSVVEDRHKPIRIEYPTSGQSASVVSSTISSQSGAVIGSKSGKKYYFPWCGTVKRIKPENQVHFESIEQAKKAGFTPGGNCKGLK